MLVRFEWICTGVGVLPPRDVDPTPLPLFPSLKLLFPEKSEVVYSD